MIRTTLLAIVVSLAPLACTQTGGDDLVPIDAASSDAVSDATARDAGVDTGDVADAADAARQRHDAGEAGCPGTGPFPEQGPCQEGATCVLDCNLCTCIADAGAWSCTTKACP